MLNKFASITFLIVIVFSISLSGCATTYNPATGRKEVLFINTQSEINIGKSAVSQIGKKYKISDNRQDSERLNRIGQKIARVSDRQDLEYSFYLIEDTSLNALTVPGGHVYMFRGLYDLLDDNELSCVLAHEVGHAAARHPAKRLQATLGYQILSTIAMVTLQKGAEDKQKQAAYMAYAASTAFDLALLGYSRQDEFLADELAVKYAKRGGFDPQGMIGAFNELKGEEKKGVSVPYILRSHPYIDERIKRIETKIAEALEPPAQ